MEFERKEEVNKLKRNIVENKLKETHNEKRKKQEWLERHHRTKKRNNLKIEKWLKIIKKNEVEL